MCKLIIFTVAPLANKPKAQRLLFNRLLLKLAETEKDGLGIAYLSSDGKLRRRRWAKSYEFKGLLTEDLRAKFCEEVSDPVEESSASGFVIMHGRTASSKVCLRNSHPHIKKDTSGTAFALIHNGVVDVDDKDKAKLEPLVSTCDSELILNAFIDGGMENVSKLIRGRYAFAMIVNNPDGTSFLHVVKDDQASLYAGEDANKNYIFATTPDILKEAGAELYAPMSQLTHLTFSSSGELIGLDDIPKPPLKTYVPQGVYRGCYGSDQYQSPVYQKPNQPVSSAPADPKQSVLALPEPGIPTSIHEIDRKIAKAEAKGKHVRALRLKSIRSQMIRKEIREENATAIINAAESESSNDDINSVPLSDDEAMALFEAERQASGVGI